MALPLKTLRTKPESFWLCLHLFVLGLYLFITGSCSVASALLELAQVDILNLWAVVSAYAWLPISPQHVILVSLGGYSSHDCLF